METNPQLSKGFKSWIIVALGISVIDALAGFIKGGMGDYWSGLFIFIPCALVGAGLLWQFMSAKRTAIIPVLAGAIIIHIFYSTDTLLINLGDQVINAANTPDQLMTIFRTTFQTAFTILLFPRVYTAIAIVTAVFTIAEWKHMK